MTGTCWDRWNAILKSFWTPIIKWCTMHEHYKFCIFQPSPIHRNLVPHPPRLATQRWHHHQKIVVGTSHRVLQCCQNQWSKIWLWLFLILVYVFSESIIIFKPHVEDKECKKGIAKICGQSPSLTYEIVRRFIHIHTILEGHWLCILKRVWEGVRPNLLQGIRHRWNPTI